MGWECEAGAGLETRHCEAKAAAENAAVKGWRREL